MRHGGEDCGQCIEHSKFLSIRDHIDIEVSKEVHVVCVQESFPDILFLRVCQKSDHGEADLCAIGHEEDEFVDKKIRLPI